MESLGLEDNWSRMMRLGRSEIIGRYRTIDVVVRVRRGRRLACVNPASPPLGARTLDSPERWCPPDGGKQQHKARRGVGGNEAWAPIP